MRFAFFVLLAMMLVTTACAGKKAEVNLGDESVSAARNIVQKAVADYHAGCNESALKELNRAHEMFTLADDQAGVAMCMNNMGTVYRAANDAGSAAAFFEEAFGLYQRLGDTKGAFQALANKAAVLTETGDYAGAKAALDRADALAPGPAADFLPLLNNRGVLLARQGELEKAEALLRRALAKTGPDNLSDRATVNAGLGNLMKQAGRHAEAMEFFKTALEADTRQGFYRGMADDLAAMAECGVALGNEDQAIDWLKRSIKLSALTGDTVRAHNRFETLVPLAEKHQIDITIFSHLVKQWLKGERVRSYCR
ncbi:MAG: tetratricopeptide repeat protein [Thermodesulfobacteriota bacterium]